MKCHGRTIPQLEDITQKTGIRFEHLVAPEQKYILESMSGGVLLLDYDRDGWLDIYFTNAPTLEMANKGEKARSALYRNNHAGTFTDVTENAGIANPCFANGGAVGDYNNDGWQPRFPQPHNRCLCDRLLRQHRCGRESAGHQIPCPCGFAIRHQQFPCCSVPKGIHNLRHNPRPRPLERVIHDV